MSLLKYPNGYLDKFRNTPLKNIFTKKRDKWYFFSTSRLMSFLTSRASFASTPEHLGEHTINVVTAKHSFNSELYRGNPNGEQQRIGKESWDPRDVNNPQRKFVVQ